MNVDVSLDRIVEREALFWRGPFETVGAAASAAATALAAVGPTTPAVVDWATMHRKLFEAAAANPAAPMDVMLCPELHPPARVEITARYVDDVIDALLPAPHKTVEAKLIRKCLVQPVGSMRYITQHTAKACGGAAGSYAGEFLRDVCYAAGVGVWSATANVDLVARPLAELHRLVFSTVTVADMRATILECVRHIAGASPVARFILSRAPIDTAAADVVQTLIRLARPRRPRRVHIPAHRIRMPAGAGANLLGMLVADGRLVTSVKRIRKVVSVTAELQAATDAVAANAGAQVVAAMAPRVQPAPDQWALRCAGQCGWLRHPRGRRGAHAVFDVEGRSAECSACGGVAEAVAVGNHLLRYGRSQLVRCCDACGDFTADWVLVRDGAVCAACAGGGLKRKRDG